MDLQGAWSDARSFNGESDKFIGDYLGMAARPKGFVATLPLTRPVARLGKSQLFVSDVGEPAPKKKKKRKRKRRGG
jgi:hypothetical protein